MTIPEIIQANGRPTFSFEVLPPLKGNGFEGLRKTIDALRPFAPSYINITTHRSEYVYRDLGGGLVERARLRRRPGTVAVAAAIEREYGIPTVPHILCSGFTKEETEYVLLDLQFLGITHLLALRGDKAPDERAFRPVEGGWSHTTELIGQINDYNAGRFIDGSPVKAPGTPFDYGVACYPEKHEEAPNRHTDFQWFKRKVELGASYAVTQMFFDNEAYFAFVRRAREEGVDIPIVPGIKPLTKLSQLANVPKTFHCDLPEALVAEAQRCANDEEVAQVGKEWAVSQCRELLAWGAPGLHFYTVSAVESLKTIIPQVF